MKINSCSFGKFVVNGKEYKGDIKIINGKIKFWQNHDLGLEDVKRCNRGKTKCYNNRNRSNRSCKSK